MKKGKILIVEDNKILLTMMRSFLERAGFEVKVNMNGKGAIELINTEMYDLFIIDIMLPLISGIELVHSIRQSPLNAEAKVIIVSDFADDSTIHDGFRIGANDFLKKPITPNELVTRVNHHLSLVLA